MYLIEDKNVFSHENVSKIRNAIDKLNYNFKFSMLEIKIDDKSIEIILDFDMSLDWSD